MSLLRSRLDFSFYTPEPNVPQWLSDLANISSNDLGVLAILGPSGINVSDESGKRVRAIPDTVGIFLSGLAGYISTNKRRLAVGIPPAARHLPLLLASSVVLANTLKRSLSRDPSNDGCVLVISPDLALRSRYCDLFVQREALELVYAGSRMRPTGERVALRQGVNVQSSQGVCFFLPGLILPEKINFRPALIVLDLRYSHWIRRASNLLNWIGQVGRDTGVLVLYTIGDSDTAHTLNNAGFSDFPLDHSAMTTCTERVMKPLINTPKGLPIDWGLMNIPSYLYREHEVIQIKGTETIESIFTSIGTLIDEQKQKNIPDLNRARWLLATLTHIPVPLTWYEQAARSLGRSTLRGLISKLGVQGRHNSEIGAVTQTLRMQFDQIYRILNESNLRSDALRTHLPRVVNNFLNEQVLLIVRDSVMERAVQNWLELEGFPDADWLNRIIVKACPNYYSIVPNKYAAVLVNGIFPRRYKWIAGASLGTHVTFLAYPYEVEIIEHQLQSIYGKRAITGYAARRDCAMSQLVARPPCLSNDRESTLPYLQLKLPLQEATKSATKSEMRRVIKDITKLAETIKSSDREVEKVQEEILAMKFPSWKEDISDEDPPDDTTTDSDIGNREDTISCIRLRVQSQMVGEGMLWLAADNIIDFVRASSPNDIQRAIPQKLRSGDVLLLMNEGRRESLFDQFVELAEDQPQTRHLAIYRRSWREAIQKMVARYQDQGRPNYAAMLSALRGAGATIQSEPAVRSWVQDQVIGPDNIASIVAVGHVSGIESIVREAKVFDQIFRDIRIIRQSIGRRLNSAIRRHFKHFAEGVSEAQADILNDRLRLPLDELLETIDFAEVMTIGDHFEKVMPHRVGRIRPIE